MYEVASITAENKAVDESSTVVRPLNGLTLKIETISGRF